MSNQIQNSQGIFIPLPEQSFSNRVSNQANPVPTIIQPQPQIQNQQIISNQMAKPQVVYVDTTNFKTSPCNTVCPFCKNQIQTQVNKKCNWYSWLLCYCIGLAPWMVLQCCRNKNVNCYNAEHFCPNCGNKIAEYNSC